VVAAITPWNYPHLCTVNSVVPALLAGNAVIIKPAPQTPVSAERVLEAFTAAGLPQNVLQVIHLSQETTLNNLCADPRIDFVAFTGSVPGGRAVQEAAANGQGFKGVGLELGGKDPAYVREDVDLKYTVANLVDGAFFNSGQSCCAIERIYVHSSVYDEFVKQFVALAKADYVLGDPTKQETTLGPVVSLASAARIRKQVADAVAAGAKLELAESEFPGAKEGTTLVGPQVLTNVDHSMDVMAEETFGPVIGIMKVESDDEALALMNDSPYGLTASVWTNASDAASINVFNSFVEDLEAGTVYLNRADALDPALPWTGVKNSGRGISLSTLGYDQLTRAKSVMMRVKTV
jgi:acyl-CoA reductase-like NAD-dependent aldehyde dehydrogenase